MARFGLLSAAAVIGVLPLAVTGAAGAQALPASSHDRPALVSTIIVDALAELPASGDLFSLLDAAQADLISDRLDTGGLSAGEPARIGAHGSSWTQTRFRVGDATINDPEGTGAPMLLPNLSTWERVDVSTGLLAVESNAPGLAITLEPRRPGAAWTRTLETLFSGPAMLSRTVTTTPPAIAHLNTFGSANLFASGPVVPGLLGVTIDADLTRSSRFERYDPTPLDATIGSVFTHLELSPTANDHVRTLLWLQGTRSPLANRLAFGQPTAAESGVGVHLQSRWERQFATGLSGTLSASFTQRERTRDDLPSSAVAIERLTDGPVPGVLNPRTGTDRTWSIAARVMPPTGTVLGRRHTAGAGFEASGGSARTLAGFSGMIGERVNGVPARVWQYIDTGRESLWDERRLLFYASDRFELLPRVQLDMGIRFEAVAGSAAESADQIRWTNWLPRASLRWEVTDVFGLAAFAGFGRYGYELPLTYFSFGDDAGQTGRVYRWNATSTAGPPLAGQIGELIARVGPGTGGNAAFSAIDPGLIRPYLDEFVVGFESRPRPSAVIRLAAIARRERPLVGLVNVGVPAASYSVMLIPDPGLDLASTADDQLLKAYNRSRASFGADRYLLTNPTDDEATYVGVDITGQTNIQRLFLLAGATAGRSEGLSANRGFQAMENDQGVIGELFTNPNALTNARGRLFTERGYTLKIASVYRFPKDVRLGFLARYQDGQHFARLVLVNGLNQGPEIVRAFRNGRTRFTYSMTVDARIQKGFTFGTQRVDVILDGYNLFNTATEVEEFVVTGPTSRLTAAVQPPRAIHAGLRVTF